MTGISRTQQVIAVLWPGFLVAAASTIVFFTAFDPHELLAGKGGFEVSRLGAYTIGFFLFWMITSLSSLLTCYFQRPCEGPRPDQHT
jgi:hypothetical protein